MTKMRPVGCDLRFEKYRNNVDWARAGGREGEGTAGEGRRLVPLNGSDRGGGGGRGEDGGDGGGGGGDAGKEGESSLVIGSERGPARRVTAFLPVSFATTAAATKPSSLTTARLRGRERRCTRNGITK